MARRYIDSLLDAMTFGKKYLAESVLWEDYDYPDEYGDMPQEEMPMRGGQPPMDGGMQDPRGGMKRNGGEDEEMQGQDLSAQDERISQIREIALDGLQEYCEDVDSEMYQFYKKVWLMCDKAVSENDSAGD
jgi:hypothetical protein